MSAGGAPRSALCLMRLAQSKTATAFHICLAADSHMAAELSVNEGESTITTVGGRILTVINRTKPNCVRCRNHGLKTSLKGHKRYCKYKNCRCSKCIQTTERQHMMAIQIAKRRRDAQDEERRIKGLPVPSPSPEPENPDTRKKFLLIIFF